MTSKNNNERNVALTVAGPHSGSSLVPMLIKRPCFDCGWYDRCCGPQLTLQKA
jgi:hypothetical protein